ncbi:MAG: choice-of-anchor D domain-containing protein [Bacteroidota bacterium]|nr:choice-of-anchor D domain-containing protein [Bacteroidota bacterium]MDP4233758.1 choice-of-anchor D domain-containing protein [Bacteroidota bacterium]MDP4242397.1 choice-of-anchor D domain-containing protein [Bacteroidota bacterium]MDP4287519.1 choice-of-anchor D domain-containing protein [Bacteroidota bacterium]
MVRTSRFWQRVFALLVAVISLCPRLATGQSWVQIGALGPANENLHCVYFWNSQVGVASGPFQGLYYYRNGFWTQSTYSGLTPQSLRVIDGVLYSAANLEVWKSLDSGVTWSQITVPETAAWDVYRASDGKIHGLRAPGSFARIDSNICAAINDDGLWANYSLDVGLTWSVGAIPSGSAVGGWGIYGDTCRREFFAMGEDGPVRYSLDSGRSWHFASQQTGLREDLMEGADGVLYHYEPSGVYRSVDAGFSWDFIRGPAASGEDYHFCVFGPQGDTIVATSANEVWICKGASLNARPKIPVTVLDTELPCGPATIPVVITGYGRRLSGHLILHSGQRTIDTTFVCAPDGVTVLWLAIDSSQKDETLHITLQASDGCRDYEWLQDVAVHRVSPLPQIQLEPKLTAKTCDLFPIPIILSTSDCGSVVFDSLQLDTNVVVVSSSETLPDTLIAGQPDTVRFVVFARHPGNLIIKVHCHGLLLEGNKIFDTILNIPLSATPVVSPIIKAPHTLTVSNCIQSIVPIFLQASPCDSVQFWTCNIAVDPALKYQSNLLFPRTVTAGTWDTLRLIFPPQGLARATAIYFHLTGIDDQTLRPFDTTFEIIVTFTNESGDLEPDVSMLQLDTTSMCSTFDTVVTFRNFGCDTIWVTKNTTLWQSGWSASDVTLPLRLPPDSAFSIRVHFTPTSPGSSTQFISYLLDGLTKKGVTSQQVRLSADAVPGNAILSLRDPLLDFGEMTICNADTIQYFTIANDGCDTLLLSSMQIDPAGRFALLDTANISLAPDSSHQFKVRFSSGDTGIFSATFHVHGIGAYDENPTDRTLPLEAHVTHGSRIAALNVKTLAFDSVHVCEERDTAVWVKNSGCDVVTVFGDSISGINRSYWTDMSYPISIPPGDSILEHLHFSPDTIGQPAAVSAVLHLNSNSDSGQLTMPLLASIEYPSHFSLMLGNNDIPSAFTDQDIVVRLTRQGLIPTGLSKFAFSIQNDNDLLGYQSIEEADIQLVNTVRLTGGDMLRSFTFTPVVDRPTIATLHFHSYLAPQNSTAITFTCDSILPSSPLPVSCIAKLDSTESSKFHIELVCGQGTIQNQLRGLPIFVSHVQVMDRMAHFTIEHDEGARPASAEILDILGERRERMQILLDIQNTAIDWDLSNLPSGAYFLRVTSEGFVATRRLMILE